jgi:molybdenum cofactor cytidylyltransferase
MSQPMAGLLLAAGQSRRFGANKLLQHVIDDTPMLLVSAQKLASALPDSIVVINEAIQEQQPALEQLGLRVIVNSHADQGMGSSIACGVAASSGANGWLIALADMPYVSVETIKAVAVRLNGGAAIVAPLYQQQRGHPVAFAGQFRQELLALNQDSGAKDIIRRHKHRLELINSDDEGVIIDIDRNSQTVDMQA